MPLELKVQLDIILYAVLAGILLGAMFDLYRIIRGNKVPKLISAIEDILFSILAAISIFLFLLYTNYAFLGFYIYILIGISVSIYLFFISPKLIKVEMKFFNGLGFSLRVLSKWLMYPMRIIMNKLKKKNN